MVFGWDPNFSRIFHLLTTGIFGQLLGQSYTTGIFHQLLPTYAFGHMVLSDNRLLLSSFSSLHSFPFERKRFRVYMSVYLYTYIHIYIYVYIYIWSSVPTPLGHGHGSAIVLSPCPSWCGGGVVLNPFSPCGVVRGVWCGGDSVCMTIYIIWHGGHGEYGM